MPEDKAVEVPKTGNADLSMPEETITTETKTGKPRLIISPQGDGNQGQDCLVQIERGMIGGENKQIKSVHMSAEQISAVNALYAAFAGA